MKKVLILFFVFVATAVARGQNIDSRWAYFINDGRYESQRFYLSGTDQETAMVVVEKNDPITIGLPTSDLSEMERAIDAYYIAHRKRATIFVFDGKQPDRAMSKVQLMERDFFGILNARFDEEASLPRTVDIGYLAEIVGGPKAGVRAKAMDSYMIKKEGRVNFMGDSTAIYRERTLPLGDTPVGNQFNFPVNYTLKSYLFYDARADKTVAVALYQICVDKEKLAKPSFKATLTALLTSFAGSKGYAELQERLQKDQCSDMTAPFVKNFRFKTSARSDHFDPPLPEVTIVLRPVKDSLSFPPATTIGTQKRNQWQISGATPKDIAQSENFIYVLTQNRLFAVNKTTGETKFLPDPAEPRNLTSIAALGDDAVVCWCENVGLVRYPSMEVVWQAADPTKNYDVRYDPRRERIVLQADKRTSGSDWVIVLDQNFEEVISYQALNVKSSLLAATEDMLISTISQIAHYRGDELLSSWDNGVSGLLAMVENNSGNLCGISEKELWHVDTRNQKLTKLIAFDDHPLSIANDQSDNLIIGCKNQLLICKPPYTNEEPRKLQYDAVRKILVDQYGNLWFMNHLLTLWNENGIVGYGKNAGVVNVISTLVPTK